MIDLDDRILLNNGTSIVTDGYAVRKLVDTGSIPNHIKVAKSTDSDLYDLIYRSNISINDIDESVSPEIFCDEDYETLINNIISKRRDDTEESLHTDRVEKELEFFINSDNMPLLCSIEKLIGRFKEDNIVWGVGRGSSCASYVLFLLEVHDINPIKYDISFTEFSKE